MLTPRDEADLAEAVASATGPLAIVGGGTRDIGRAKPGETLSVAGLSGISLYEPGALTMVAKAGTPVAEIEAALDREGQMLAFEPLNLCGVTGADGSSTIGGVFATNASGARRVQGGAARDYLLGVRFVDGQGTVAKNGGRVMKNVTGYDLVKLMAGAHGTLGVLTEVSFKVLPKPEAVETVMLSGLSDEAAVKAMSAAMGSPYDVSGAMHTPGGETMIRVEGFTDSVSYRAGELATRLAPFGDTQRSDGRDRWTAARQVSDFGQAEALWFLSVKPSDAPGLIAPLVDRFGCRHAYDWAGGRIIVGLAESGDPKELHAALQEAAAKTGGHARLVHGPATLADAVPIFQPEAPALAKLAAGLRARFDPRGILNPGLMG